jgi:predicted nucleic acid-binding protein
VTDTVVLDSSFLADVDNKVEAAIRKMRDLVNAGEPLNVPAIVAVEFATGASKPELVWAGLRESYRIIDFTDFIGERASALAQQSFRRGTFPGWSDVQVAATASVLEQEIITRDARALRAFEGVRASSY